MNKPVKSDQKKKINWQAVLAFSICLLAGYRAGYYIGGTVYELHEVEMPGLLIAFIMIAMFAAAFIIQFILHEGGHLLFGLISGYRFSSFRICSLMFVKLEGRYRFRRLSLPGTGGQCLMIPPPLENGRIPVILYNLGGALMNIAAALIAGIMVMVTVPRTLPWLFEAEIMIAGITLGFLNGIPMRAGPVDNDGYNALSLKKNPEAMRAFWIQMMINAENADGHRLSQMPDEWFVLPEEGHMQNSLISSVAVFCCNRLADQHRFDEALLLAEKLIAENSGVIGLYKNLLICDIIYMKLIRGDDYSKVNTYLSKAQKKMMKAMKHLPQVIRTEYAIALLGQDDSTKAEKILTEFEKAGKSYPYMCDVISEGELIEIAVKSYNDRKKDEK